MSDSYTNLLYHIVFSTKDRQPLITLDVEPQLFDYVGGIIRGLGGICLELNGKEDHVHLLAKLRPDCALSDVLRELKANGIGWMHAVFPELKDFSWQRGYGASRVSQSNVGQVTQYIRQQKEHRQKISFRDEFIQFLKANGIEYDERYFDVPSVARARGLRKGFCVVVPGVPLRSTPGFTLSPRSAG